MSSVSDEPQKTDSAYAAAPTLAAAVRTSDVTGGYRHKARQFSKWINSSSSAQLDIRTFTTHTHTCLCVRVCVCQMVGLGSLVKFGACHARNFGVATRRAYFRGRAARLIAFYSHRIVRNIIQRQCAAMRRIAAPARSTCARARARAYVCVCVYDPNHIARERPWVYVTRHTAHARVAGPRPVYDCI